MTERFDFNADAGAWAFRGLPWKTVEETLRAMDGCGISRALAGPVAGITYRNCHKANEELARDIAGCAEASERLVPAAVLNPAYPGAMEDLRRCDEDLGARALKLYPNYHGYRCWEAQTRELCQAAGERGMVVMVVVRVEDERFHHWKMLVPATPMEDILKLVEMTPGVTFILSGATAPEAGRFLEAAVERGNCHVELSYVKSPMNAVETLVQSQGSERLLLGTHLPFVNPGVSTQKVLGAVIEEADREAILWHNAARLLGL